MTTGIFYHKKLELVIWGLLVNLERGHNIYVPTHAHWETIKCICKELSKFKDQILFRFMIGSSDNNVLKFWEPNAPLFDESIKSLKFAYMAGFQTSVSCVPMFDNNIHKVIEQVEDYVSDSICLGNWSELENFRHC